MLLRILYTGYATCVGHFYVYIVNQFVISVDVCLVSIVREELVV